MSENSLAKICQIIGISDSGDLSTQASNINYALSGENVQYDIGGGGSQPQLFIPLVNRNTTNAQITFSTNSNNGGFQVTTIGDIDGTLVSSPITWNPSYVGKTLIVTSTAQNFIDSVVSYPYVAQSLKAPLFVQTSTEINFQNTNDPVFNSSMSVTLDGSPISLPYSYSSADYGKTIICTVSALGCISASTVKVVAARTPLHIKVIFNDVDTGHDTWGRTGQMCLNLSTSNNPEFMFNGTNIRNFGFVGLAPDVTGTYDSAGNSISFYSWASGYSSAEWTADVYHFVYNNVFNQWTAGNYQLYEDNSNDLQIASVRAHVEDDSGTKWAEWESDNPSRYFSFRPNARSAASSATDSFYATYGEIVITVQKV